MTCLMIIKLFLVLKKRFACALLLFVVSRYLGNEKIFPRLCDCLLHISVFILLFSNAPVILGMRTHL